jgi:hypothetical protein
MYHHLILDIYIQMGYLFIVEKLYKIYFEFIFIKFLGYFKNIILFSKFTLQFI